MAYPRKIETRLEAVIKDLSRGFPIKQAARRQGFTAVSYTHLTLPTKRIV